MTTQAEDKEIRRSTIESEYNVLRDAIEKQYIADREALENTYHQDLKDNEQLKRDAFIAEGLNSDGADPQGRPQG
jgi:hypothetical protein